MDSKKFRSLKDYSSQIESILIQTGASQHTDEYIEQIAYQLQSIFQKIQLSCQKYFDEMNQVDEEMQETIKQHQFQILDQIKNQFQNLSDIYSQRCSIQEDATKNLSNIQSLNNQLLGSKGQWNS